MLSLIANGFFTESPVILFPIIALLLFTVVFTAISLKTMLTDQKTLAKAAGLPLASEQPHVSTVTDERGTL